MHEAESVGFVSIWSFRFRCTRQCVGVVEAQDAPDFFLWCASEHLEFLAAMQEAVCRWRLRVGVWKDKTLAFFLSGACCQLRF